MTRSIRGRNLGDTKERILELLLEKPLTSSEIAEKLKIQKSAVRTHLESLQSEKAVTSYFKMNVEGLGRPGKVYQLTHSGRELFVRKYDEVLYLLLNKIMKKNGKNELLKIVESITDDIADDTRNKMQKLGNADNLHDKLKRFNIISNEMGFMSDINKEDDGSLSVISKNCILHKLALTNQDIICHGLHNRLIAQSLKGNKSDVNVQLKDCIALGNDFCKHIIVKKQH